MDYTHTKTIEGDGFIIRIHRPNISADEREKRMKAIRHATERLLKEEKRRT